MNLIRRFSLALLPLILAATGCRSRVIYANLVNASSQTVSTIIVDYPGGTFGVNALAPGKTFPYRFKPIDSGPLKIQFTNAQGVTHNITGPTVVRDQEGRMDIKFTQDSASVGSPAP